MAERGIDIAGHRSKQVDQFTGQHRLRQRQGELSR
jgi:hypothetical protein